jgi:hypothetical protein
MIQKGQLVDGLRLDGFIAFYVVHDSLYRVTDQEDKTFK